MLGSASRDPSTLGSDALRWQHRIRYQRVVLGFVVEQGRSRWLTDAEISAGALAAVDDPAADPYPVGQVDPWVRPPLTWAGGHPTAVSHRHPGRRPRSLRG